MSFSLLLTSCENEKSEIPMPNYKVLGVNSFTIDGVAYTATDGLLLNTGGTSSIALVGMTTSSSTLHSDVEYAIYSKTGVDLSVSVRSIYSDVSISVQTTVAGGKATCIVKVSREAYKESITYKFVKFTV